MNGYTNNHKEVNVQLQCTTAEFETSNFVAGTERKRAKNEVIVQV